MSAGLAPPNYFGGEVVARYLGLRYTHPPGEQKLALYPWNPITRAEAAHSFAVVLGHGGRGERQAAGERGGRNHRREHRRNHPGPLTAPPPTSWEIAAAREALTAFSLPTYTAAQREVLHIAVAKIGMPYMWGGTTDNTADGLEHGGYDCSGFAWRVYKLSGLPWGRQIRGRTAAEQAGEIPKRQRIHLQDVAGRRPAVLRLGPLRVHRHRVQCDPRGDRDERRMGDQLLRAGRLRAAAHLRLAGGKLHLGPPGAVGP